MSVISDLLGTLKSTFKIGLSGPTLKNTSGNLTVRNTGDSADAEITASKVNVSGDVLTINSDAAGTGSDFKVNIQRATSGMTADVTLTLPVDDGTPNQVLATDGSGVLSWVSAASTSDLTHVDTTSLAFGSSATTAMFTLPANAVISAVEVVVDTAFNGSPTMTVGVSGNTSKYLGSTDCDLTAAATTIFRVSPGIAANVSSESLIITYAAGGASAGAARVLVYYANPA